MRALARCVLLAMPAGANSRLKDVADFEGVRGNLLVAYRIVVGLDGTRDSLSTSACTEESLVAILERPGLSTHAVSTSRPRTSPRSAPDHAT